MILIGKLNKQLVYMSTNLTTFTMRLVLPL